MIKFKLLYDDSVAPGRSGGDIGNAGIDLFAHFTGKENVIKITKRGTERIEKGIPVWLKPGDRAIIPTGVACAVSVDMYLRLADRGGNAAKLGLHCLAGVVDSNYRGEIKAIILNTSHVPIQLHHGAKICQAIPTLISNDEIEIVSELDNTERDEKGGVNEVK